MPYWTTDIGGFFRPGRTQYTDPKYQEILTRWFQWGTFNPIFRIHGYQTETEPWKYGDTVMNNMRMMLNLRYRLIPYIYSEAWQVSSGGSTMMRPLVMDFRNDAVATGSSYEYMFGKSLLVAPVVEPGITSWNVYLPKTTAWYDFWTGKKFQGGQTITTAAPQDKIPVFVKAGSIVPMGKYLQYTSEKTMDTLEIRVYTGANGNFTLYNDEGDNYNYEKGKYITIPFTWNDQNQTLTVDRQKGNYAGAVKNYVFNIVWVNEEKGTGIDITPHPVSIAYSGNKISISKR
jgi:alpha-D-xyloside xylohydrolase